MTLITKEYRKLNEQLHTDKPSYGCGGHRWHDTVIELVDNYKTVDVLDYGSGKGTLAKSLDFVISEYDPCVSAVSYPKRPHDIVICTDVLEHIEPECIDAVIADIAKSTLVVALLVISIRPAKKTLPDGRNAHLIIEDAKWWTDMISDYFVSIRETTTSQDGEVALICEAKQC